RDGVGARRRHLPGREGAAANAVGLRRRDDVRSDEGGAGSRQPRRRPARYPVQGRWAAVGRRADPALARHAAHSVERALPRSRPAAGGQMTHRQLRFARILGLAALLACAPAALRAQTLRGKVNDLATRGPVAGATIILVAPDSTQVASAISGDDGSFT